MKSKHLIFLGLFLVALTLVLAACSQPTVEATPCPTCTACPEPAACPAPPACPTAEACPAPVVQVVPFQNDWANSPHNDVKAEAFNHWNEDDPKEVPVTCAQCHSTPGYMDFLGADGSAPGKVDNPAPIGTTITCQACHNSATATLSSVTFPSGVEIKNLGPEARCMVCHQGRTSYIQVNDAITKAGLSDDDTVSADLGFVNIHYFAAAVSLYGTKVKGGYEYLGKSYDAKNDHVAGYDTCIGCHNQHTLEVRVDECKVCHTNVSTKEDLVKIRMAGSAMDYDGNGDTSGGISSELDGLRQLLLTAMQSYANEVSKTAIAYNPAAYPYFFVDTNGDGKADEAESKSDNGYKAWTGRLLKAAYNYQVSIKDPGAFAHGGKYLIELLYDSIEDLNTKLTTPVDLSKAHRIDAGHFAGSQEPFRHWDEEASGLVPAGCVKCHTKDGLPFFMQNGVTIALKPSNGLNCATCHNDLSAFTRYAVNSVKFPSGKTLSFGDGKDANLCLQCHQGRESKVSVDAATKGIKPDEIKMVDDGQGGQKNALGFKNIHYFAAGVTLFGTESQGAYEYDGQTYLGKHPHVVNGFDCTSCHDVHALTVKVEVCSGCHPTVKTEKDLKGIRVDTTDFDGDGVQEGIAGEIETFQEHLLAAIQAYAKNKAKLPILYNASAYPYFFADANDNGKIDEGEGGYTGWTPRLLEAAYNYQLSQKDPGTFAHNGKYILQILYDSTKDLGGDVAKFTRPK